MHLKLKTKQNKTTPKKTEYEHQLDSFKSQKEAFLMQRKASIFVNATECTQPVKLQLISVIES